MGGSFGRDGSRLSQGRFLFVPGTVPVRPRDGSCLSRTPFCPKCLCLLVSPCLKESGKCSVYFVRGRFGRLLWDSVEIAQNRQRTRCTEHASKKIRPSRRLGVYIFQEEGRVCKGSVPMLRNPLIKRHVWVRLLVEEQRGIFDNEKC